LLLDQKGGRLLDREKIIVKQPEIYDDYMIKCSFSCPKKLEPFFTEKLLWVKYNRKIRGVPKHLLTIPLLTNILPIAWASDVDVHVEEIDGQFLRSAEIVRNSFQVLYPKLSFRGKIYAKSIIENRGYSHRNSATLFSGGVDSLTTYIRKRQEKPSLITVWGSDIAHTNSKAWKLVEQATLNFAKRKKVPNIFLKSNFRSMLNYRKLIDTFSINWWGNIQHGYALIGLSAPITYTEGVKTLYIPSTYSNKLTDYPWGSHPLIDANVKWGETSVVHDGYELTRQDKLGVIARYIHSVDPALQIRVCWESSGGKNCSFCEKCSKTMVGLFLAGVDPNRHGFKMNRQTLDHIKTSFMQKWKFSKGDKYHWVYIQKAVVLKKAKIPPEYASFFAWLEKVDLSKIPVK
jgi:hypothetical protein